MAADNHLDQIPLLDASILHGYRQTIQNPDTPDIVTRLIDIYCDETPISLAHLHQALRDLDADMLYKTAHALKSSSGSLGALRLAEMSKHIEQVGRAGDLSAAKPVVSALSEVFSQTRQVLKQTFPDAR